MPALPQQWSDPGSTRSRRPGMRSEHGERRVMHPLGMLQVTGRVVGHVQLQSVRPAAGPPRQGARETSRTFAARPAGRFVAEQMAVVLEQRAAAGAVDHDVVGRAGQGGDVHGGRGRRPRRGRRRARAAPRSRPGRRPRPLGSRWPRGFVRVASWTWRKSVSMTQPRNRATVGAVIPSGARDLLPVGRCKVRRSLAPLGMTAWTPRACPSRTRACPRPPAPRGNPGRPKRARQP